MFRVMFKNVESTKIIRQMMSDRISSIINKFPDLKSHTVIATLSQEKKRSSLYTSIFKVKLFITGKRYKHIVISKSSSNYHFALASVVDHSLEKLNRFGDKMRIQKTKN